MLGNTDKPLESIKNDTFGIASYVDGLSKFILNCDTPMTISIQGDWGSGKTSMMNMIREETQKDTYTIWFNTWQFSQFKMQDELAVSMLYSLLNELDCNSDKLKKVFGFLGGAMKMATGIITERIAGGYLADQVTDAFVKNGMDMATEIKELKEKIQEAINDKLKSEKKERAVMFIDDLDRLQPEKAVELLEVLKIFLDCENCVYVLAVDYEVVTQGIRKKFGDAVGLEKGKNFFDKIIQLPFRMPVAQYNIYKYVENILSNVGIEYSDKLINEYVSLISLSIGCNPRSMKRLFNTYLLLNIIHKTELSKSYSEEMYKILFAIICIQTEFYELYRYIIINKNILDSDFFIELEGDLTVNNEVKEGLNIDDDDKLNKISSFMKYFNTILNFKNDDNENSIESIKNLLNFSTVTAVNINDSSEEKNDFDWKYRYINKKISNKINYKIKEDTGFEFKLWQARKNRNNQRISDAWNAIYLKGIGDVYFSFGYELKTEYAIGVTTIAFYIGCRKPSNVEDVFNLIKNSLNTIGFIKYEYGYKFENVYKFSDCESDSVFGKIVEIVEDMLKNIITYTER